MKIFKKIAAVISSAMLVAVLSINVTAEEVVGFDYAPAGENFVYYDFTAEDGATGTLKYTKDGDGNLYFSSYTIDAPAPESPVDFPEFKEPDKGYRQFFDGGEDFFSYFEEVRESSENGLFEAIVVKFDLSFDPPLSDGTFSMDCAKYYIADLESKTVRYVGSYCLSEAIVPETANPDNVYEYTAEDGTKFYLYFDKNNGAYCGYEAQIALVDYAIDGAGAVTIGEIDGYKLLEEPPILSLADNERLVMAEVFEDVENEFGEAFCIDVEKYFVITLNGEDSTVRYIGSNFVGIISPADVEQPDSNSDFSDGETTSPNTGNGNSFFAVMLAAAGLAVLAKFAEK